ncbi:uncharacterized protein BP5553_08575 [Venustampulla echinocandica]|uniref:Uncharacterized protein n=1 Tax=Venustampulla echinocandica TaxID=2656787 RepID=A0A370TEM6_9HELO|nr:uncharacterized protein BP5553_08575 [Venustampulla echinocandica]RDL33136.1 hypothetical protein BP5553_08575 [Venustampulla echinocandica]
MPPAKNGGWGGGYSNKGKSVASHSTKGFAATQQNSDRSTRGHNMAKSVGARGSCVEWGGSNTTAEWDTCSPVKDWEAIKTAAEQVPKDATPAWGISEETGASAENWGNCDYLTYATEEWVDTRQPKTVEELIKERVDKALEGWPWVGIPSKLMTLGPIKINLYPDDQKPGEANPTLIAPAAEREYCPLFDLLFSNRLILDKVMGYVCQSHDSQWKFIATCSTAWNLIRPEVEGTVTELWDMSTGNFNGCDEDVGASVRPVLVIAPIRMSGSPLDYTGQIKNLYAMSLATNNVADNIRNIQFHRIPFLTTNLLDLLIPKMRNLEHLGVYKCELIHFGDTLTLMDIIKIDRPLEKKHSVNLDFYPNFHRGPIPGPQYYAGPYGVTWDNWNGNSLLGIWCMMSSILPIARRQGIDFTSKGTMFRKWLDDGPCWRIEETTKALLDPTYDTTALAALVDCSNPQHHGSVRLFTGHIGNRPEGYKWTTEKFPCFNCRAHRLGIFFWYGYIREARMHGGFDNNYPGLKCYGCLLDGILRGEQDHYKVYKQRIIQHWLIDSSPDNSYPSEFNKTDLPRALREFTEKNVAQRASRLQAARDAHIARFGFDRETQERQKAFTHKELNTKYGMRMRTPLVWDKNSDPKTKVYKNPGDAEWDCAPHSTSTMFAHGRW